MTQAFTRHSPSCQMHDHHILLPACSISHLQVLFQFGQHGKKTYSCFPPVQFSEAKIAFGLLFALFRSSAWSIPCLDSSKIEQMTPPRAVSALENRPGKEGKSVSSTLFLLQSWAESGLCSLSKLTFLTAADSGGFLTQPDIQGLYIIVYNIW